MYFKEAITHRHIVTGRREKQVAGAKWNKYPARKLFFALHRQQAGIPIAEGYSNLRSAS